MPDSPVSRKGALLSYLGAALFVVTIVGMFLIWLVPTIIRATTKDDWTREHATAAADFGWTALIGIFVGSVGTALLGIDAMLFYFLSFVYLLIGLVALLAGAVRVWHGQEPGLIRSISLNIGR